MTTPRKRRFDVIVVGAGPAGSTMAWALAQQGIEVALLERRAFPREKVCGDFIEPGGLRLLARMGVLHQIDRGARARITKHRVYFGPKITYRDAIQYYQSADDDINYGLVVPRHEFDTVLLEAAVAAGAVHFAQTEASAFHRQGDIVRVEANKSGRTIALSAPLIVGADGVESLVARGVGLRRTDRRHIGVSQRAYVEGVDVDLGEATVWFDEDIAPGYGWMFPVREGVANVGVGFGSQASERFGLSPQLAFRTAVERLRIRHPGCAKARLISRPIGGVVKSYGGIDRNHFDGGLLIGDAGSFIDALSGEGITQGMESAILALPTIIEALEHRRFGTNDLARFEQDFRRYFDPSMRYLELSAALVNNRHLAEFWFRVGEHGHEEAAKDPVFAAVAGSTFGGPALQPLTAGAQVLLRIITRFVEGASQPDWSHGLGGRFVEDLRAFQRGWTNSRTQNPDWHREWLGDIAACFLRVQRTLWTSPNPRPDGVFRFVGLEAPRTTDERSAMPLASPEARTVLHQGLVALFDAGQRFLTPASSPREPEGSPRRRWRVKS